MPDLNAVGTPLYGRDLAWLDDATIIGQDPATNLVSVRPIGGRWTRTDAGRGCNCIVAAQGRAFAHLTTFGLFDALTGTLISRTMGIAGDYNAARGSPGQDGTIGLLLSYTAGTGLRLLAPDGSTIDVMTQVFADLRQIGILDRSRALWCEMGNPAIQTCGGLPVPQLVPGATLFYPQPMDVGGRLWLGYHTGSQLVLHPFDSLQGYAFPVGFYPRFRALDATRVAIVWAVDAADTPAAAGVQIVDVTSAPTVNLTPAPAPVVFSFSHPVLVAPYKDPAGQTTAPVEIVVNQTGQTANRPYFVASDSLGGPFVGPRLGVYTEALDPAAGILANPDTRVVVCHDAPDAFPVATLAELRPWDLPLLELYLEVGETLQQSTVRWTQNLSDLLADWPGDVGVDLMFYCEGGAPPNELFTVAQVLDGLRLLSNLVNASPRVKLIACFEYERANGITGHPELADAFTSLLAAASAAGLAALTPIGEPTSAPLPSPAPVPGPDPVSPPEPVRPVVLTPYPAAHVYTSKGSL